MKTLRNTLLGACLMLPLLAATGQTQTIEAGGRTINVPPGAVVLIIPGASAAAMPGRPEVAPSANMPIMQLIAQQQAAMQRMMAQMNAMFPMPAMTLPAMPGASQLVRAAFGAGGPMLTMAGGPGVCSESISIVQHGNGAPVITRTAAGACGAPAGGAPHGIDQVRPAAPVAVPHGPAVLEVSNPPHPIGSVPPHA